MNPRSLCSIAPGVWSVPRDASCLHHLPPPHLCFHPQYARLEARCVCLPKSVLPCLPHHLTVLSDHSPCSFCPSCSGFLVCQIYRRKAASGSVSVQSLCWEHPPPAPQMSTWLVPLPLSGLYPRIIVRPTNLCLNTKHTSFHLPSSTFCIFTYLCGVRFGCLF